MNGEGLFNTWWKITLLILGLLLIVVLPGFAFPTWYTLGQDDEYVFTGEPPAALNIRNQATWLPETNLPGGDWGNENYKFRLEKLDADGNNMVKHATWYTSSDGGNSSTITCTATDHGLNTGDIIVLSFVSTTPGIGNVQFPNGVTDYQNTETQNGSYKVFSVTSDTFQVTLKITVAKPQADNHGQTSFIYWYKSSCNDEEHDQNTPSQCKTGTSNNPLPLGFDPGAIDGSALAKANWNSYKGPQPIVYALQGPWGSTNIHDSSNKKIYFKIVGKDLVFDVQHNNYFPYQNDDLPTGFSINFDETTSSLTTTLMEQGAGKIYSNAIVKPDDKLYLRFMECTSLANGDLSGCDKSKSLGYITVPKELKPVKK